MNEYDYIVKKGETSSNLTLTAKSMLVKNGGMAMKIDMKRGSSIDLYGRALQVKINADAVFTIYSGFARDTTVYDGIFNIVDGGSASASLIYYGSVMNIVKGSSINDTIYGGVVNVGTDTPAEKIQAVVENTAIKIGGIMNITHGGKALSVSVQKNSKLNISAGGTAEKCTVSENGTMTVSNEAVSIHTVVEKNGTLKLEDGSVHNGILNIEDGGKVIASENAKINITIKGRKASDEYFITNQALIEGAPVYTVYADKNQASGTYKLAGNTADFSQLTINIQAGKKNESYIINVNQTGLVYNKKYWYLMQSEGDLILSIAKPPKAPKISVSNKKPTNQNIIVTAVFSEGSVNCEYSFDNKEWFSYNPDGVEITENCTVYFRSESAKGIISPVVSHTITNIDRTPPEITDLIFNNHPRNINAALKNIIAEDASGIESVEYKFNDGEWTAFKSKKPPKFSENGTLYIKVTDKAGNEKIIEKILSFDIPAADDWQDMKTAGANSQFIGRNDYVINAGKTDLAISEWVGLDEISDYHEVDIQDAGSYSFEISANDKIKLTIYQLVANKNGTFKLKALQNTAAKKDKNTDTYIAETKNLLLENGKYYFCVTSTNAKSGAIADYTVSLGDNTIFYPESKFGSADDLKDVKNLGITLPDTDKYTVGNQADTSSFIIGSAEKPEWVGFGDAVDYKELTLDGAAKLSFEVNASDKMNFTVYQLIESVNKNGVVTYKLKALQSSSLKAAKDSDDYSVITKDLLLGKGKYYLAFTSTNANKGGNASYSATIDTADFILESDKAHLSDNSDDSWKLAAEKDAVSSFANWVGFGDAKDYFKFETAANGQITFDFDETTAAALADKQIKISCLNENGKSVALTFDDNKFSSQKELAAGTYYIGITSTNAKKFSTEYSITLNP